MIKASPKTSTSYKKYWEFLSQYFLHSDEKWSARKLLASCIFGALVKVGLGFVLGWWFFPTIYAAFTAKNTVLLLTALAEGLAISVGMAGFHYLNNFFKNTLYVNWRSWLTKETTHKYLKKHLEISRIYKDLDNPEQRIQEDLDQTLESALDLSLDFIDNFCNLVIYTVLLVSVGGSLSFMMFGVQIIIPGFLVLVAYGTGIASSFIGHLINRSMREKSKEETIAKSNIRVDLRDIRSKSEEIAIEHAEKYYQARLDREVEQLNIKTTKRLEILNRSTSFNVFNGIIQAIIPLFAVAPLFLNDLMTLEGFYAASYYISMTITALSWMINSSKAVNKFLTSLDRIAALQTILDNDQADSTKKILRSAVNQDNLVINNLTLNLHDTNELIIKGLNLIFTPGIHTLLQAPSGAGKSSVFKAIAGTWVAGEGEIIIPGSLDSVYFLPQNPTLPNDTLRNVLAYPDAECSYSDEELVFVLKAVKMESLLGKLGEVIGFKSMGEQQRIAFARILLRKPTWVFLDEATASVDETIEQELYALPKKLLPNTTVISIAHRSTVRHHHDSVLFFNVNANKEFKLEKNMGIESCNFSENHIPEELSTTGYESRHAYS